MLDLAKNPLNWITVTLMLVIVLFAAHLILTLAEQRNQSNGGTNNGN